MIRVWPFNRKRKFQRDVERAGRMLVEGMAEGIRQGEARRKAGLPPEPLSDEAREWAARVAHRSFPSLYLDDDEEKG